MERPGEPLLVHPGLRTPEAVVPVSRVPDKLWELRVSRDHVVQRQDGEVGSRKRPLEVPSPEHHISHERLPADPVRMGIGHGTARDADLALSDPPFQLLHPLRTPGPEGRQLLVLGVEVPPILRVLVQDIEHL